MIRSFKCKETKKVFNEEVSFKLPINIQKAAIRKLSVLNASTTKSDLKIPKSNHFKKLKGTNKYSIRINKQWRICFNWENNNVYNVEITDYH